MERVLTKLLLLFFAHHEIYIAYANAVGWCEKKINDRKGKHLHGSHSV